MSSFHSKIVFFATSVLLVGTVASYRYESLKLSPPTNPCVLPDGIFDKNLDLAWVVGVPKWYTSRASESFWVQSAQAFLGRDPHNYDELTKMCLKVKFDLNSTMEGYGKIITHQCTINKTAPNPYANCSVSSASPGTNYQLLNKCTKRVVATNNRSYAVFARCCSGVSSFYLAQTSSKTNKADVSAFYEVLARQKLGVDKVLRVISPRYECRKYEYGMQQPKY